MVSRKSAVVIGAGIAGASVAYFLGKAGVQVTVIDAAQHTASHVPSALINPVRGQSGQVDGGALEGMHLTWALIAALTAQGYDIPPFASMADFKVWETEGPPVGTIFNYPMKPHHQAQYAIAFSPAPPELAQQMYLQALNTKVIARVAQGGESVDAALTWLEREINNMRRGG